MIAIRIPPGRAGRLWLRARLAAAERAADLLDQKARVLRAEHRRRADAAERSRADWASRVRAADAWTLRATLLAGERALVRAAPSDPATVEVGWARLMGVHYPERVDCSWPERPSAGLIGSSAHIMARIAHRDALGAAAQLAVDEAASTLLAEELTRTNRRVRALRRRWIPALNRELARVELMLAETDRAEAAVRRRALDTSRLGRR